jgi:hypothetical protein
VRSAIVSVPVRELPEFAGTRNATVPLPFPLAPEVIVMNGALLVAAHVHPLGAPTATLLSPAAEPTVCSVGVSVNRHGAASCMMRTRLSLMTISASRAAAPPFGATRKSTLPLPCPDEGETSRIQLVCVDTLHSHSGWAVTEMVPVPPSATTFICGVSVIWHLTGVGPVATDDVEVEEPHPAAAIAAVANTAGRADRENQTEWGDSAVIRNDASDAS